MQKTLHFLCIIHRRHQTHVQVEMILTERKYMYENVKEMDWMQPRVENPPPKIIYESKLIF